jgi:hypothetical protein
VQTLLGEIATLRAALDDVYRERNAVVAALIRTNGWPASLMAAPDEEGWWIVYAETPLGQVSWHVNPVDVRLFDDVPRRGADWDGHDTDTKYERIAMLARAALAGEGGREVTDRLSDLDPFTVHDPGCHCWPHVSESALSEAVIAGAVDEYRASKATIATLRAERDEAQMEYGDACMTMDDQRADIARLNETLNSEIAECVRLRAALDELVKAAEDYAYRINPDTGHALFAALAAAKETP